MEESGLFEGKGTVQNLSVKELYQGIQQHIKHVCVPVEHTNCVAEVQRSRDSIRNIKRNWFELQRRNVLSFPLYYGPPGHLRIAEYPEYLSEQLPCSKCLAPIPLHTSFFIQVENYMKIGTQECGLCTKQRHNQPMTLEIHGHVCRLLLNTIRIIGVIVEDRLSKLIRLEREMSML
jgi:hypothetical protein